MNEVAMMRKQQMVISYFVVVMYVHNTKVD